MIITHAHRQASQSGVTTGEGGRKEMGGHQQGAKATEGGERERERGGKKAKAAHLSLCQQAASAEKGTDE